ncbi:restriction endonuclease [Microbacterium sp.]|uniref:restriction endonuclease n=1 Tax=Microbacterium sp. TaxID=51671 RepID=UPI003F95EA91
MTDTPWQVAENIAETHLNELGFFRVQRTVSGADGGLDVIGQGVAAQVKLLRTPVGSPDVQRLRGAAHRVDNAVFYAHRSSGYSRSALRIADDSDVALFTYDLDGTVAAVNQYAAEIESPLGSMQRAIAQTNVASVRWAAVKFVTDHGLEGVSERLGQIANELEAIVAALPDGATLDDLPAEVHALKDEGAVLMARHHGRLPNDELEATKVAMQRSDALLEEFNHDNLVELLQTRWRDDFIDSVSSVHAQLDLLTTATISWLGTDVVQDLRDAAVRNAGSPEIEITPGQAVEGWPILPRS